MNTVETLNIDLPVDLSDESRVWIYQAERNLSDQEVDRIRSACAEFVPAWQAHGKNLKADYRVLLNRFICLFVDESNADATGCSIDRSVHFIQELEKFLGIGLMERTTAIYIDEAGKLCEAHMNEMKGTITPSTLVANNLISTLGEMREKWIGPASESWHSRLI